MSDNQTLEDAANEIIKIYGIDRPPVQIETILQQPREGMWEEVDVTQLSGSFLSLRHRYSPRMSLTRMLARHVAFSEWGKKRGLDDIVKSSGDDDILRRFARMLIMPSVLMERLNVAESNPDTVSLIFEVPDDDAQKRLEDLL